MKIVLDTNVLISGIYFGGLPGKILEAWGGGDSDLLNVSGYCGINVLTPKAFVSECLDQSD